MGMPQSVVPLCRNSKELIVRNLLAIESNTIESTTILPAFESPERTQNAKNMASSAVQY
jgi:hypothetical protein